MLTSFCRTYVLQFDGAAQGVSCARREIALRPRRKETDLSCENTAELILLALLLALREFAAHRRANELRERLETMPDRILMGVRNGD